MAKAKLPDQAYLRECFDYDPVSGIARWKTRPASHFPTEDIRGSSWSANRWNSQNAGKIAGHERKPGHYLCLTFDGRSRDLHRLIWKWMTGEEIPQIDHRDTQKTNNAWSNLRPATPTQNGWNKRVKKNNRAGLKGVRTDTRRGGFIGRILIDGRDTWLGKFATAEEAHAAYCAAARAHFGEFWNPG